MDIRRDSSRAVRPPDRGCRGRVDDIAAKDNEYPGQDLGLPPRGRAVSPQGGVAVADFWWIG